MFKIVDKEQYMNFLMNKKYWLLHGHDMSTRFRYGSTPPRIIGEKERNNLCVEYYKCLK